MDNLDFIKDLGGLAIASRLKRLSELLFLQVSQVYIDRDIDFEPKWFPTFMAIFKHGEQSILEISEKLGVSHAAVNLTAKELLEAKLICEKQDINDKRRRILSLTAVGKLKALELEITWKDIRASVENLLKDSQIDLITSLNCVEDTAKKLSISERAKKILKDREQSQIEIIPFEDQYAGDFESLNKEWITKYFYLEESDQKMLPFAKKEIIDQGGEVLFARDNATGKILGTSALKKHKDNSFELTKMAVTETAQGRGIGKMLAKAMIEVARKKGLKEIFLETNSKLITAIHLYKQLGFTVVPIPEPSYSRADVKMTLSLHDA